MRRHWSCLIQACLQGGNRTKSRPANYVRLAARWVKATLTIQLASAQRLKIHRRVGSKFTVLKLLSARKRTIKYVTDYKKTYTS